MVAVAPATNRPSPKNLSSPKVDPTRTPLLPSEKDNAAVSRRPPTKQITSRYLSSSSSSSSTTTTTSSFRRHPSPSPLLTPRPSTPTALPRPSSAPRRSLSVGRARPDTAPVTTAEAHSAATRAPTTTTTTTTTRSLSVSFQGESFYYQTSRAKAASPKPALERRRPTTPTRAASKPVTTSNTAADHSENPRPFERWPAARARQSNPLVRSLGCSDEKEEPILVTVRRLQRSMVFDGDSPRRASFDGGDLSTSSDTDSVSSGSNSGGPELSVPTGARATPRGICIPARFWQETNSRLRRLQEPGSPLSSSVPRTAAPPKLAPVKKPLVASPISSPRSVSSPIRGPIPPSSPSNLVVSRSRGMASPPRVRNIALASAFPSGQPGNAPSIISFAAEVRRAKKGESRIEEAHMLRLLDNRHLQWRFVNARTSAALMAQRLDVEKDLFNAWMTTSGMRDSVTIKRIKQQLLAQDLSLTSILKGQMAYLEEWSLMDRDHSSSLSGAIEALKASILRLPVVGGARADLQEVKNAVGSAVDVMQAMGSSICSLLSKVEGMASLVSEHAKVAAQERALLDQSRDLLSTVAAMHVTQCSLRGHVLQLKSRSCRRIKQ